jgi:hypothetical protein
MGTNPGNVRHKITVVTEEFLPGMVVDQGYRTVLTHENMPAAATDQGSEVPSPVQKQNDLLSEREALLYGFPKRQ